MSAITQLIAGVPVSDLDASIDWYTRFFGRPPDMRAGQEILWDVDEHAARLIGRCGSAPMTSSAICNAAIEHMHRAFADLGDLEDHVVDSSRLSAEQTAQQILASLDRYGLSR